MNATLTTPTAAIDATFLLIFGISALMLVAITVAMLVLIVTYHRRRHPQPSPSPSSSLWLEITWTLIPTLLVLSMFHYGWTSYTTLRNVPEDALEVEVSARMWSWSFTYPDGRISDRLYVPVGRPVKVRITTADILHSFYVPAFRIKKDAVPGLETYTWFLPQQTGTFDAYCAEYCGVGHADMMTTVEVLSAADFAAWYRHEEAAGEADGHSLLQRHGCLGCHSLDGSPRAGPTFLGIAGRPVTVIRDGAELVVTTDADYLRRAIREPNREIVKGYPPIMSAFDQLTPAELEAIVSFLLKGP